MYFHRTHVLLFQKLLYRRTVPAPVSVQVFPSRGHTSTNQNAWECYSFKLKRVIGNLIHVYIITCIQTHTHKQNLLQDLKQFLCHIIDQVKKSNN